VACKSKWYKTKKGETVGMASTQESVQTIENITPHRLDTFSRMVDAPVTSVAPLRAASLSSWRVEGAAAASSVSFSVCKRHREACEELMSFKDHSTD
jgi:hypothetical protein